MPPVDVPLDSNFFISRAQMKARTDPGMVTVMKALLGLWHSKQVAGYFSHVSFQKVLSGKYCSTILNFTQWNWVDLSEQDSDTDLSSPIMYVDSLHRRPPWSRSNLLEDFITI